MLETEEIRKVALKVATKVLPAGTVKDTLAEPVSDSEGKDAWRVTVVLEVDQADRVGGEEAVSFLVELHDELGRLKEPRQAIVNYATTGDIETDADD